MQDEAILPRLTLIEFSRNISLIVFEEADTSGNNHVNTTALKKLKNFLVSKSHLTPAQLNVLEHKKELISILSLFEFKDSSPGKPLFDEMIKEIDATEDIQKLKSGKEQQKIEAREMDLEKQREIEEKKNDQQRQLEIKEKRKQQVMINFAREASKYARETVREGSMDIECNELSVAEFNLRREKVHELRWNSWRFFYMNDEEYNLEVSNIEASHIGNCFERGLIVLKYIIENSTFSAGLYAVIGECSDHVVVVMSADPLNKNEILEPEYLRNSRDRLVFIDASKGTPDDETVFLASDYRTKLNTYWREELNDGTCRVTKRKIKPGEKLSPIPHRTTSLRDVRNYWREETSFCGMQ